MWGGHSIRRVEYDHQEVRLRKSGLRGHGCRARMRTGRHERSDEGSHHCHSKQAHPNGRLLGHQRTTAVIAAEPPKSIGARARHLPDIEKRMGLRTFGSWDRSCSRADAGPRRNSCISSASCSTPRTRDLPFPGFFFLGFHRPPPTRRSSSIASKTTGLYRAALGHRSIEIPDIIDDPAE